MERTFLKDTRIISLEENIKNGNIDALGKFYKLLEEKKSPLIEKIQGEDNYFLVTIIYREEKKLDNVVLIPPVGMRNLKEHIMNRLLDTDIWYISYKVEKDIMFSYHFSINDSLDKDWEKRWRNAKNDKFNKNYIDLSGKISNKYNKVSYVKMPFSSENKYMVKKDDVKRGAIKKINFNSKVLNKSFNIYIYLPYGFNKNKTYGMLVLNDGYEYLNILNGNIVLDNLISDNLIKPIIGVFIEADKERGVYFKCNDKYTKFLGEELPKFIKTIFNISFCSSDNIIGGYSLGGLLASYTAIMYPNIFGNVISQSGSYWYNKDNIEKGHIWINDFVSSKPKENIKFYINVGKIEPKKTMIESNLKFKDKLIELGYDVYFEFFNSGHDYLCWGETLGNGLVNLFNRKS